MAFQTYDVIKLMETELGSEISALRVDGGASANNFLLEFQANILSKPIVRPECIETTALGAAALAGLAVGFFESIEEIKSKNSINMIFNPDSDKADTNRQLETWHAAVERSLNWIKN